MTGRQAVRYEALDGWRGGCALLVALHHFQISSHLIDLPLVRNGYLFVDFFFVLSGFVISHTWGQRIRQAVDFRRFMIRRFARVWPLHAVVLSLFVTMEAGKAVTMGVARVSADNPPFTGDTDPVAVLTNVLLVHSLGLHDRATWNFPSWSISTEFYTYAVFGLLCLAGLTRRVGLLVMAAAVGAAMVALCSDEWLHTIADFGFFRCVYGFFSGCVVQRLAVWHAPSAPLATLVELAVVVAVVALVSACEKGAPLSMLAPVLFALAVGVFAAQAGTVSLVLRRAVPQALGTWSYSIYMLHSLVLVLIGRTVNVIERLTGLSMTEPILINGQVRPLLVLGAPWVGDVAVAAYVLAVAGLSALAWRWIERPAQSYLKRLAAD